MTLADIPVSLIYLACIGGFCYLFNFLLDVSKDIVNGIRKAVRVRKVKKEFDSISENFSAEIDRIINNCGKEES